MSKQSFFSKWLGYKLNGGFLKKMNNDVVHPFTVNSPYQVSGKTLEAFQKAVYHDDLERYVATAASLEDYDGAVAIFQSAAKKVHPNDYRELVDNLVMNKAFAHVANMDSIDLIQRFYGPIAENANSADKIALFTTFERSSAFADAVSKTVSHFPVVKTYADLLSEIPDDQAVSMLKKSFNWAEKSHKSENFRGYVHQHAPRFVAALTR